MRLITIKASPANAEKIIPLAFDAGMESVSIFDVENRKSSGENEIGKRIEIDCSTSKAKEFLDRVMADPTLPSGEISIITKQPRAILSNEDVRDITLPMPEPIPDLMEELWQFSHVTYGLVGRVLVSSGLLAYGLIEQKLLLMIAGLMFLPILPMLMAISFGIGARQWRLALKGFAGTLISLALLFVGGVLVADLSNPPLRYDDFNSIGVSIIISAAVGGAAALASIDDAGRREMIGLAAASQLAIIPSWLGVCVIFGLPGGAYESDIVQLLTTLAASFATIVISVGLVHRITGLTHSAVRSETRIESRQ